jgi:NifB/MoaA-like Fe-S oxidoreductase
LFGETVTVTGLIAGKDVIDQLAGKDLGDVLFVPSVALRDGAFLDDVTLADVKKALGVEVEAVIPRPYQLVKRLVHGV